MDIRTLSAYEENSAAFAKDWEEQPSAADLHALPGYRVERVQLFDMFPHTAHYEVLTLLVKCSTV